MKSIALSDCRSHLHLSELQRVVVTVPKVPYDTAGVNGVCAVKVVAIEVATETGVVPPAASRAHCTINTSMSIVVCVDSRKHHVVMVTQRIAYKIATTQTHRLTVVMTLRKIYGPDLLRRYAADYGNRL